MKKSVKKKTCEICCELLDTLMREHVQNNRSLSCCLHGGFLNARHNNNYNKMMFAHAEISCSSNASTQYSTAQHSETAQQRYPATNKYIYI